MKQRGQIADMDSMCQSVEQDWSGSGGGLIGRLLIDGGKSNLKDTVHGALGNLIKQRKVYYTGNKGYFLVAAAPSSATLAVLETGASSGKAGASETQLATNNNNNDSNVSVGRLGSLGSQLRHSLRNR